MYQMTYHGINIGERYSEFDRYDMAMHNILESNGKLRKERALLHIKGVGRGRKGERDGV